MKTGPLSSSISTAQLTSGVLCTTMVGRVTAPLCERQLPEFEALLAQEFQPTWVIDVTRMSGFDAPAVSVGARWFEHYKKSGGRRLIYVSHQRAARMAAQALGFSTGVVVECSETLEDVLERFGLTPFRTRTAF